MLLIQLLSFLTGLESLPFFLITDVTDLDAKQTRAVHISRQKFIIKSTFMKR